MRSHRLPVLWLRLRLALAAVNPVAAVAVVLLLAGILALAWLVQAQDLLEREQALTRRMAALPAAAVKVPGAPAEDENLALFQRTLGERRYAEQQVKTLFGLAARSGLLLRQGEYREGFDRAANVATYQVTLPIKGSYRAVWDFALQALLAIPFASLDEISFRRDAIGDTNVEARLRFTLYLADKPAGGAK